MVGAAAGTAGMSTVWKGAAASSRSIGVIAATRQTGADRQSKYKETSLGGLAVNFVEC